MAKHIEEKFETYHKDNPHVYDLFVKFAKEAKGSGMTKFSANGIFERIRWFTNIETTGERFKISNNYRPYYARKMMKEYPEFEGFFSIKELK